MGVGAPSGTVTFLFTDIEGSTCLWEADPSAMREALERHDVILRTAIDACGGQVFSTGGDGFAAAFARAGDGVDAAMQAQRLLQAETWPDGTVLRVRMGLHTGETAERDGDYFGPAVNRAARACALANGGQIVMSEVTASLLGHPEHLELIELGSHRLRGVAESVRLLGVKAVGLEWDGRPLADAAAVGNLPRPVTEFFGRA